MKVRGMDVLKKISLLVLVLTAVTVGQDTIPPKPVDKIAPAYPENARKLRIEAQIFLNALISKNGTVSSTSLLQAIFLYPGGKVLIESKSELTKIPSSHRNTAALLLEISQKTAKKWRFIPATIHGKPEQASIMIPFTFKLTKKPAATPDPPAGLKK